MFHSTSTPHLKDILKRNKIDGKLVGISIFLIIMCQQASRVLSIEKIVCPVSYDFANAIDYPENEIFDAVLVEYSKNKLSFFTDNGTGVLSVLMHEINIRVIGDHNKNVRDFSQNLRNLTAVGVAKLQRNPSTGGALSDCQIFFIQNRQNDPCLITTLAESCMSNKLCSGVGMLNDKDSKLPSDTGAVSLFTRKIRDDSGTVTQSRKEKIQAMINIIADISIKILTVQLEKINNAKFSISDIVSKFFNAWDGTAGGFSKLQRFGDFELTYENHKLILSGGIKIPEIVLTYEKYQLGFIISSSSRITYNIVGFAVTATIMLDYNSLPCLLSLNNLEIREFGDINGNAFYSIVNKGFNWLINYLKDLWKEFVSKEIAKTLEVAVMEHLIQFNCEQYRP